MLLLGLSACTLCSAGTYSGLVPDGIKILNELSMKCIMPLAGSSASGVSIVAATCNGSAGQYWQLTYVGQQRYKIMNKQSQLCINDPRSSTSSGTTMIQYACGTSANGLWTLSYDTVSDSWSIINGASGLSLNASYADGSPVIQYPFINALNMRWKF